MSPRMIEALCRAARNIHGKVCPQHTKTLHALVRRGYLKQTSPYAGTLTDAGREFLQTLES